MKRPQIAVIDFGSQYTHLITRRVRQLCVLAKIYPPAVDLKELKGIRGLILSGGPNSVYDKTAVKYNKKLLDLSVPILGLCYGHQLLAHHFGGEVKPGKTKEYGFAELNLLRPNKFFSGLPKISKIWMSHGDSVKVLPQGFSVLAKTFDCPVAAMADDQRKIYGLQFHPEVAHTRFGLKILSNFIFGACRCKKDWSLEKYWQEIISGVKKTVGKRNVFLLVSGGVDSSVCFSLLEKILGKKRVFGLHIDNGFMRLDESQLVKQALAKAGFDDLFVLDASGDFLRAVKDLIDPEKKRAAIGKTFLAVKDKLMAELKMDPKKWILGQGTIYPDTIETGGTAQADKIKTHHNRVKEVLALMKLGDLVEPLVELYKDEVRQIGKKIGLPKNLLDRHPFPGPGLSIRALCASGRESKISEISEISKIRKIVGPRYKSTILPLKSVGVQGDNRTYRHPALISGPLDFKKLHDLSVRLTNEVREVNRVVYLVLPKFVDFRKLKIKKSYLTKNRLDLLRVADNLAGEEILRRKIYSDIWQFPVVLAPLGLKGGEAVILRPVQSKEAMTVNFYQMKKSILEDIAKKLLKIPGLDLVLYDITNKPPGTIEWE